MVKDKDEIVGDHLTLCLLTEVGSDAHWNKN